MSLPDGFIVKGKYGLERFLDTLLCVVNGGIEKIPGSVEQKFG